MTSLHQEAALLPARFITDPGAEYGDDARLWQGIPGIERAVNGRLWAVWYSGGRGEGPENYLLLVTSEDDGATWSGPRLVVRHTEPGVRCFDPVLWHDPRGRLWLFWAQSLPHFDGRAGVWASVSDDAGGAQPTWSAPLRLMNGVMMNKPTVLSTGEWLLPAAVWSHRGAVLSTGEWMAAASASGIRHGEKRPDMAAERFSNAFCSTDEGATWQLLGQADVPDRYYDEHMIVERLDGTLWMLVRTTTGVGEAVSADRGRTWIAADKAALAGPNSRFFIRRLASGRLLLVNHVDFTKRNNLTAMLSDDDGRTWYGHLLLDGRNQVSYPDGVEAPDGRIYIIYDRERTAAREILMAVITEDDIRAGKLVREGSRLRVLVNRAHGEAS